MITSWFITVHLQFQKKKFTKPIFTWKKHLMTGHMWLFMMHAEQAALNSSAKASRVGPRGPTHGHFWSIVLAWPCWSTLFTFHRVRTTSLHKNIASIAVQPKAMLCHSMPCLWMHPLVFQSSSSRLQVVFPSSESHLAYCVVEAARTHHMSGSETLHGLGQGIGRQGTHHGMQKCPKWVKMGVFVQTPEMAVFAVVQKW